MKQPFDCGGYHWWERRYHPAGCDCWKCTERRHREFQERMQQSFREAAEAVVREVKKR